MRRAMGQIGGRVVGAAWLVLTLACPIGAEREVASGVERRGETPKSSVEATAETAEIAETNERKATKTTKTTKATKEKGVTNENDAEVVREGSAGPRRVGSRSERGAGGRPSATQARGLDAPPAPLPMTLTPHELGPLGRDTEASGPALAALFPSCSIVEGTYDHLGRSAPYFEVLCGGVAVLGVLADPGPEARIVGVRVLAREVTPPSGFGVGVRYAPLAELNPDLECRRATLPGAGDLFPEASTICAGRLAPNILYLFRAQVFRRGSPDPGLETRRIDELIWLPQAGP